MRPIPSGVLFAFAAVLAGLGVFGLVRADRGLTVERQVVQGVPLTVVWSAAARSADLPGDRALATGRTARLPGKSDDQEVGTGWTARLPGKSDDLLRPGVVVAHGFAGSARLMAGFGDTLARRGYAVVLLDFAGHGANAASLPDDESDSGRALQDDIDIAVTALRDLPGVDPARIALVGHSMGAGAVTRYAAEHPDITATVAISLGDTSALPAAPRNLLTIVGALEFPVFRDAALEPLRRADPAARFGMTVGDPADGDAVRAVAVPWVEHISVLYAPRTHAETANWLDAAMGLPPGAGVHSIDRVLPAAALLLAGALGAVPLIAFTLPGQANHIRPARWRRRTWQVPVGSPPLTLAAVVAGCVVAVAVAPVLPTASLPHAVGGFTAGFLAVVGAVLLAVAIVVARLRPAWWVADVPTMFSRHVAAGEDGTSGADPVRAPRSGYRRHLVALLIPYAMVVLVLPLHLGVTHVVPTGPRWWLGLVVLAGCGLFLAGVEVLTARRAMLRLVAASVPTVALVAAALVGLAPPFVVLVAPLLVVLLCWYAGWAAVLDRHGAPRWVAAAAGAMLLAWPVTCALPVLG